MIWSFPIAASLHPCSASLRSYRLEHRRVGVFDGPGGTGPAPAHGKGPQQGFYSVPRNRPVVMNPVCATIRWSGRTL